MATTKKNATAAAASAEQVPPKTTRLSDDVSTPQPTDPGDAPADTYDPKERASSVASDKETAAAAGYQTVNAVIPVDPIPDPEPPDDGGRTETYTAYDSQNNPVSVEHNLDTGETTVSAGS